ncbi:MAG: Na+/Ca+ antiporter, CaCA family [Candidatus Woesebacteria bacterium GW2011_GWB1_38_5b]|uniref:Na+/Ca+ antiporter, CaCA family n=1 Tax=Candidatus Woesebacteria bacterium GW2011_GWB1_38_5b TaxID=1618569 RepID=A0A0G0KK27_9BACT|nr:MAG: Na+/Ca+ antiporter, CaCA family [Candidatus Woesebacteria bacterium GW2011_GWB1_38_5b]
MINIVDTVIYIISFLAIWMGSQKIVSSIDKIARRAKISSFILSFVVLGLATSVPELAVGITAISQGKPDIFVGNLLGGISIIFLFIIPLLAILANGVAFNSNINHHKLLLCLFIAVTPLLFLLDKSLTQNEALLEIGFYVLAFMLIKQKASLPRGKLQFKFRDLAWAMAGLLTVYISANVLVEKTIEFAEIFSITPFLISLVIVSFGTNLPELFVAIQAVILRKKDVALGDYAGSALANVLFMGLFTFLLGGNLYIDRNFTPTLILISLGLLLFYYFASSKNSISRKEGFVLLGFYSVFVTSQALG